MDIPVSEIESFLNDIGDLRSNESNIWTVRGGGVAIGVVLLAHWESSMAVVRKEAVHGYEFSDMLSLPGGLVRGPQDDGFAASFTRSLLDRAGDEAGIEAADLSDFTFVPVERAPVSRYTAKGAGRLSFVFAIEAKILHAKDLSARRKSIREAFFVKPPLKWKEYAPANRLILAWALRDQLLADERQENAGEINNALSFCNTAAAEVALPGVCDPWID